MKQCVGISCSCFSDKPISFLLTDAGNRNFVQLQYLLVTTLKASLSLYSPLDTVAMETVYNCPGLKLSIWNDKSLVLLQEQNRD